MLLLLLSRLEFGTPRIVAAPSSVHATVPPVLHSVVAATTQAAGDLSPSLAHFANHLLDQQPFFRGDRVMVQVGLQVLMVPFPALLWRSRLNSRGNPNPVVGAMKIDQVQKILVLGLRPGSSLVLGHCVMIGLMGR